MIVVYDVDRGLVDWVQSRIPHADLFPENTNAIGIADNQRNLLAAAVYFSYSKRWRSMEMAFATDTPRWATRGACRVLLRYPFDLGCERITLIVPRKNRRARRFVKGIGFTEEGVARKGFYPDDAVLYGLLRREAEALGWIDKHMEKAAA